MLELLESALAGRYAIERELGAGGMAFVYLARDLKHSRRVAIKVLRDELASSVGAERFLSEIEIAAQLTHPNILALHDSGESGGLLYYVMPYVDGGSLRDRLERERQLPIDEALVLARQVASALDYAHERGVVHRDIKPENILLAAGQPVVADFGLARAVSASSAPRLTATGLAVGTPNYISPEQVLGDRDIDGRADVYSLACVVYEMIAGSAPFTGGSGQAIIARHLAAPPPSLIQERKSTPVLMDAVVQRALAKAPADRFRTAGEFVRALEETISGDRWMPGLSTPVSGSVVRERTRRGSSRRTVAGVGVAAIAIAAIAGVAWFQIGGRAVHADSNVIAVLPFTIPTADTSLSDLREGVVDLLHDKFPRTVNAGAVLQAWRAAGGTNAGEFPADKSVDVARRIGASEVVLGRITRVPSGILMRAELIAVKNGATIAQARAEGSPVNYGTLIDTVANQLLSQEAGEADRSYLLNGVPTAALKAYLQGRKSYRAGHYDEAASLFSRALDSSRASDGKSPFVFAAFGLVEASNYFQTQNDAVEEALKIAWLARDQLNARDRAFLTAEVGPRYPLLAPRRERIDAWDRAMDSVPDRPEPFFQFGDLLVQYGPFTGRNDPELARSSFERALRIDSTFAPALKRLAEHFVKVGDPVRAQAYIDRLARVDSAADELLYLRWRVATARHDERTLASMRRDFPRYDQASLRQIWLSAQLEDVSMVDAKAALDAVARAATRSEERAAAAAASYVLAANGGQPQLAAAERIKSVPEGEPWVIPMVQAQTIRDAIFDFDAGATTTEALRDLGKAIADYRENPAPTDPDRAVAYVALCAVEEWRLANNIPDSAAATLRDMAAIIPRIQERRYGGGGAPVIGAEPSCRAIIEAWSAAILKRPDAGAALDRLDSLMARGPVEVDEAVGNLVIARLRLAAGDTAAALRALRRRALAVSGVVYLAPTLREEGRIAALMGDRQGAAKAYRHYIALRANCDPALRGELDQVRAALARLELVAVGQSP
jgi:serine/threonine-protein kinase